VLKDVLGFAQAEGFDVLGLGRSPIKGPKGNIEFLAYLGWPGSDEVSLGPLIARVT
jgi:23S rRNA (cytidine1920-2'-O)/16S rRNA (cytidine1409-2'-O)-methyltransferase